MIELEFARVVGDVASYILTRGGEAVGRRVLSATQSTPAGGTVGQRFAAYERLRRESVAIRTTLDVLWSIPLDLRRVMISLPLHIRLLHRIPEQGAALNDAFLGVAMVGQHDVIQAADVLARAFQSVSQEKERQVRTRRRNRPVRPDWTDFDAALREYVACCREDLGIQALADRGFIADDSLSLRGAPCDEPYIHTCRAG